MRCPFCTAADTQVLETRESEDGAVVRRRRRCPQCGRRFTTFERADVKPPQVIKRNGAREPFDRDKLMASLELALRKRPVSREQIENVVDAIEAKLLSSGQNEVSSELIGELAMDALRHLDKIGYIRFASVYRNFEDVEAFAQFLRSVKTRPRSARRNAIAAENASAVNKDLDLFSASSHDPAAPPR